MPLISTDNLQAVVWALLHHVDKLIKIMRQVDREAPNLKPNMFHPRMTPIQLEGSLYGKLIVAHHDNEHDIYMDGLALQASNGVCSSPTQPKYSRSSFGKWRVGYSRI